MKLGRVLCLVCLLAVLNIIHADDKVRRKLEEYAPYIKSHVYNGHSRFNTFCKAFELFEAQQGKVIVELGTSRSYQDGGLPGCLMDGAQWWNANRPQDWDWGGGIFTLMAAHSLAHCHPLLHTVDIDARALTRCRVMTKRFAGLIRYQLSSSEDFLKTLPPRSVDLLYMDTGNPDEEAARLHLAEARIIIDRDLIRPGGLLLIDDVHREPFNPDEPSTLGKAKYSLPLLLRSGFEIVLDEYQTLLRKT